MKKFLILLLFVTAIFSCKTKAVPTASADKNNGGIYFIPTLHRLHKINKNYSYDSLRAIIKKINPDIIAVEMRQEDIGADSLYLKKNYPLEMRMMQYWFPNSKIMGFDWLKEELEGKVIPDNYWKNESPIKKLEKKMNEDTAFSKNTEGCYARDAEREILLKTLTLQQLIKSFDESIVKEKYDCLNNKLADSPYDELVKFYAKRNSKILKNIQTIIKNNKGKSIVIITGDDHYIELKNKFQHN